MACAVFISNGWSLIYAAEADSIFPLTVSLTETLTHLTQNMMVCVCFLLHYTVKLIQVLEGYSSTQICVFKTQNSAQ